MLVLHYDTVWLFSPWKRWKEGSTQACMSLPQWVPFSVDRHDLSQELLIVPVGPFCKCLRAVEYGVLCAAVYKWSVFLRFLYARGFLRCANRQVPGPGKYVLAWVYLCNCLSFLKVHLRSSVWVLISLEKLCVYRLFKLFFLLLLLEGWGTMLHLPTSYVATERHFEVIIHQDERRCHRNTKEMGFGAV